MQKPRECDFFNLCHLIYVINHLILTLYKILIVKFLFIIIIINCMLLFPPTSGGPKFEKNQNFLKNNYESNLKLQII